MSTTMSNRFVMKADGTIWDSHLNRQYSSLGEIFNLLQELNNFLYDFEIEISRQSNEINALIGDIDKDCYP